MSKGVSLSSNLISYCLQHRIGIDFFNGNTEHLGSILSPKHSHISMWHIQSELSEDIKKDIARRIIIAKLKNQLSLCKYFNKYHKCAVNAFEDYKTKMELLISKVKNISIVDSAGKILMPYEAQGAELYWMYVRDLLEDDKVEFYSRVGRGAKDLINSMLNFGYSLLYPRIWQTILRHKLNPYSGFIHYAEGNANLVFDLIELFRSQIVDRVVISMVQRKEHCKVINGLLDDMTKKLLTEHVLIRLNKYEKYRGEERRMIDILDLQVKEISEAMMSGKVYKPYLAKW